MAPPLFVTQYFYELYPISLERIERELSSEPAHTKKRRRRSYFVVYPYLFFFFLNDRGGRVGCHYKSI